MPSSSWKCLPVNVCRESAFESVQLFHVSKKQKQLFPRIFLKQRQNLTAFRRLKIRSGMFCAYKHWELHHFDDNDDFFVRRNFRQATSFNARQYAYQIIEEWSKKSVFFSFISLFSREREIEVWKKNSKRAKFFVHVRHFKAGFLFFLIKRFGNDFFVLGWC